MTNFDKNVNYGSIAVFKSQPFGRRSFDKNAESLPTHKKKPTICNVAHGGIVAKCHIFKRNLVQCLENWNISWLKI